VTEHASTTRLRIILAAGVILLATTAALSLFLSPKGARTPKDTSPFPVGDVFTPSEWADVRASLGATGFIPATAQTVAGLRLPTAHTPLAVVRVESRLHGLCFVPVRGTRLGVASCSRLSHSTPLLAFGALDGSSRQKMVSVVGVATADVGSVSLSDGRWVSGLAFVPIGHQLWSFAGGMGTTRDSVVVRARAASGHVLDETRVPSP
jgi:hypothetical protein